LEEVIMDLVILSDTHGSHMQVTVPDGDVLIFCGDGTSGDIDSTHDFLNWIHSMPHRHKVIIAGNHDRFFEHHGPDFMKGFIGEVAPSVKYLEDSGCEIDGVKFWGSPVQPRFFDWAFNRDRGADIKRHWDLIPDDTDVLITHGPPRGILDSSKPLSPRPNHVGCADLLDAVQRVDPKVHCFGHIHGSYGYYSIGVTTFVNASLLDENYDLKNKPIKVSI
jgi:predicted phosphohydrolase